MNKPLFCLVGPSGCGKSTLAHLLEKNHGLRPVVSCTTRPIREGEKEGVDHYFLSDEEFDALPELVAFTVFNGYRYGVTSEILDQSDLYVIDPAGVRYLKSHMISDRPIVVIGVLATPMLCASRMRERGDSEIMIDERIAHDQMAFADFSSLCDVMLDGKLSAYDLCEQAWSVMQVYDPDGVRYSRIADILCSYVDGDYDGCGDCSYISMALEGAGCNEQTARKLGLDWVFEME